MDKKEKVLCVDDEINILISLRALLRSKYEILIATSGEEALEILRKEPAIRVLISDQRMPKMLGAELLREAKKISPGTMRLLLTGYSDLQSIIDSINEGEVFRFINKPWNNQEIRFIVDFAVKVAIETEQAVEKFTNEASDTDPIASASAIPASLENQQRKPPMMGPVDAASVQEETSGAGILVVDDEEGIAVTLQEILNDSVPIYNARTINEAIELLSNHQISVIISEMQVANEDATEFVKILKQNYPFIITIILTKYHSADTMISLINQGQIYRYSYKPIQKNQLGLYTRSALARHGTNLHKPELLKRHQVEELKEIQNPSLVSKLVGRLKSLRLKMGF